MYLQLYVEFHENYLHVNVLMHVHCACDMREVDTYYYVAFFHLSNSQ